MCPGLDLGTFLIWSFRESRVFSVSVQQEMRMLIFTLFTFSLRACGRVLPVLSFAVLCFLSFSARTRSFAEFLMYLFSAVGGALFFWAFIRPIITFDAFHFFSG